MKKNNNESQSKVVRGHRKENVIRNQASISLWICGFSQWEISRLLHIDRWNLQKSLKKYRPKYLRSIYIEMANIIADNLLKEKRKKVK